MTRSEVWATSPTRLRVPVLSLAGLTLAACGLVESHKDAPPAAGGSAAVGATGGQSNSGGSVIIESGGNTGDPVDVGWFGSPFYTRVQRLTGSQWRHAVFDVLRLPASAKLDQELPPPAPGTTDFLNNERLLQVNPETEAAIEAGAEQAAALATGSPEALAALYPGTDRDGFVRTLGRRAFRRPLTAAEEANYQKIYARGEELYGAGFVNGAALTIRAMLQSPAFLYRAELGPTGQPLDDYEVASKLSFWLLDTTPSDALLDAAAKGELTDTGTLAKTAERMLEQPAAVAMMRDFHGQLYGFDAFTALKKSAPGFGPDVAAELTEASYRFFDRIFSKGLGLADIFTSTRGFVGPALAPFYGVPAPASLEERELGPERFGYFMQVPFLMLGDRDTEPDSIHRGFLLASRVLCVELGFVESPPLPALKPNQTNRERVTELTSSCGQVCHQTDSLGFAFEGFDGLGSARTSDNGRPIDTRGSFPFTDGSKSFDDARELMQVLAGDAQAATCYSKKLGSYALARDVVDDDKPWVEALSPVARDGSLADLVLALVQSPSFRVRGKDLQ